VTTAAPGTGSSSIVFVLGGSRSGKSAVAERIALRLAGGGDVTYVATVVDHGADPDLSRRIDAHRRRRPASWPTVEPGTDLPRALRSISPHAVVLIDSLGTWVAGHAALSVDVHELVAAVRGRQGSTVLVSDEVGMAVHPETEIGRRFRDVLGEVNQAVAEVADDALFVVAGRVLELQRPPWFDDASDAGEGGPR